MTSKFQITFPEHPYGRIKVCYPTGRDLTGPCATSSARNTPTPTKILDREQWDALRTKGSYYLPIGPAHYRPVPDVDFEAEDGTIHKTAEECLRHELKARFGVETLEELQQQWNGFVEDRERSGGFRKELEESCDKEIERIDRGLPLTCATPQPKRPYTRRAKPLSEDDKIALLQSALSQRGLKHCEAAKATGLKSKECKRLAKANPNLFRDKAGKLFNVDAV